MTTITNTLTQDSAEATLRAEFEAKMAEIRAAKKAQADAIAAVAHLESTKAAQAATQAQRQAELDGFEVQFAAPTRSEFAVIDTKARALNARAEECVKVLQGIAQERKALAGELVHASHSAGLRCKVLALKPSRKAIINGELSHEARELWSSLYQDSSVWARTPTVSFISSEYVFPQAERALMSPEAAEPASVASQLQTTLQPPSPPPAAPVALSTPAPKRTSYPVETWLGERAIVGAGQTPASSAYNDYKAQCTRIGIEPVGSNTFSEELADLFVTKRRTAKGVFYSLRLR